MHTPRLSLLQRVKLLWVGLCAAFAPLRPRQPRAPRPQPSAAECQAAVEEYLAHAFATLEALFAAWKAGTPPRETRAARRQSRPRPKSPRRATAPRPRRPHPGHHTPESPRFGLAHAKKTALPAGRRRSKTPRNDAPYCAYLVAFS